MGENMGVCPVCRKVFHSKDIEHLLGLVDSHSSQLVCLLTCKFYIWLALKYKLSTIDHARRIEKSTLRNYCRTKQQQPPILKTYGDYLLYSFILGCVIWTEGFCLKRMLLFSIEKGSADSQPQTRPRGRMQ
ncbi:hypothetical protein I3843_16G011500 [Carya illinoinensis]|nr:hypothetical protein I3843_16G011500 [Carya illinoinensis]